MQKYSFTILLIVTSLLLTSCTSQPSDKQLKLTSTLSPQPATASPIPSPTVEPTATPFVPLTVEEIEEKLEAYTGEELEYNGENSVLNEAQYVFENESSTYNVNSQTGKITMYVNNHINSDPEELLDEEGAKQVAIQELKKHCPSFFEYNYIVHSSKYHGYNTIYQFVFTQESIKGRRTGNSLSARIVYDGTVSAYVLINNQNPTSVDRDCQISQQQAVEATYKALQAKATEQFSTDEIEIELNLEDKTDHDVTAYLYYIFFNDKINWSIEIKNISATITKLNGQTIPYTFIINVTLDADTGEVYNKDFWSSPVTSYGKLSYEK